MNASKLGEAGLRMTGHGTRAKFAKPVSLLAYAGHAWRGVYEFLKAVGDVKAREQMLIEANRVQATRPELAEVLRRAARYPWQSE